MKTKFNFCLGLKRFIKSKFLLPLAFLGAFSASLLAQQQQPATLKYDTNTKQRYMVFTNPDGSKSVYNLSTGQRGFENQIGNLGGVPIYIGNSGVYMKFVSGPNLETNIMLFDNRNMPLPDSYYQDQSNIEKLLANLDSMKKEDQIELLKLLIEKNPDEKKLYDELL